MDSLEPKTSANGTGATEQPTKPKKASPEDTKNLDA